jgi:hypothetical protein
VLFVFRCIFVRRCPFDFNIYKINECQRFYSTKIYRMDEWLFVCLFAFDVDCLLRVLFVYISIRCINDDLTTKLLTHASHDLCIAGSNLYSNFFCPICRRLKSHTLSVTNSLWPASLLRIPLRSIFHIFPYIFSTSLILLLLSARRCQQIKSEKLSTHK